MTVKVGILGAGFMGRTHAGILRRDGRVQLSGVFDLDSRRKQEFARDFQCEAAESEEQLLDRCEAVVIAVPNTLHADAALRALEQDRHIYLEKPFATSLADAATLRQRALKSRRIFQVGHNRRFAPVYREVKEQLTVKGLSPTLAHFKMNRGELESPAWVGDAALTGGFLFETPLHLLDLARWFFGEVRELHGAGATRHYREADNFSLLLRFESGLSLTFASCAHATWAFPYERTETYGPYFTIETAEMERVTVARGLGQPATMRDFGALSREEKMGYAAIDENFVSAVLDEAEAAVTPEDGYRSVELVDRWYGEIGGIPRSASSLPGSAET